MSRPLILPDLTVTEGLADLAVRASQRTSRPDPKIHYAAWARADRLGRW